MYVNPKKNRFIIGTIFLIVKIYIKYINYIYNLYICKKINTHAKQ